MPTPRRRRRIETLGPKSELILQHRLRPATGRTPHTLNPPVLDPLMGHTYACHVTQERIHEPALAVRRLDADPVDVAVVRSARPAAHPLGPYLEFRAAQQQARARLWAAAVFGSCVGLLSVAGWVTPDASGLGSHRQLGFPACTSVMLTGYPCPTCGMTTAFAHTVRGQLISAFSAQPAGLLLALGTIAAAACSLLVLLTGIIPTPNWYRISPSRVVLIVAAVILLGWLIKLASGRLSGALPIR